jgi:N-acetylmuramoyl-L-alanine amidase
VAKSATPDAAATASAGSVKPGAAKASQSVQDKVPPPASASDTAATKTAKTDRSAASKASPNPVSSARPTVPNTDADEDLPSPGGAGAKTTKLTDAPTAVTVATDKKARGNKKTSKAAANEIPATHEASPTADGDRSLIRALGLKIGRIVIDAGHGGHDTGTIGPNGLLEKDLVLDVALRLGRLLETRLGADVIYTRDDDTFIPLETRTAIANEKQADLFVSVHANSSQDSSARGVETYYLNFTSNPEALEVAARENSVSEKSIHELQDLVKKITLKEKIEESRELASDVQNSLYAGLSAKNPTLRNRGVKKAPFVVLIGANMPSILAEISFVSNPVDEKKLETPDYRQKIAESLYKGIAKYAGGLSGVKVAAKFNKDAGQ